METRAQQDDERWGEVMESLDLLFAKVGEIENHQEKFEAKFEMSSGVLEQMLKDQHHLEARFERSNGVLDQMLKDQQKLAKQMEATGHAIAQLTMSRMDVPPSPTATAMSMGGRDKQCRNQEGSQGQYSKAQGEFQKEGGSGRQLKGGFMPKMSFPKFEGNNPTIWKEKCKD